MKRRAHMTCATWQQSAAFARLDRCLAYLTEIPAAILVAVEILVLLAGVISRYVLNHPLTWSDELASILFLWPDFRSFEINRLLHQWLIGHFKF